MGKGTVAGGVAVGEAGAMGPAAIAQKVTEGDDVRRWRLEELIRAGYPPWDALLLSRRRDVDLHTATSLVRRGCPVGTALRILL